jgi:hypothetical protein
MKINKFNIENALRSVHVTVNCIALSEYDLNKSKPHQKWDRLTGARALALWVIIYKGSRGRISS